MFCQEPQLHVSVCLFHPPTRSRVSGCCSHSSRQAWHLSAVRSCSGSNGRCVRAAGRELVVLLSLRLRRPMSVRDLVATRAWLWHAPARCFNPVFSLRPTTSNFSEEKEGRNNQLTVLFGKTYKPSLCIIKLLKNTLFLVGVYEVNKVLASFCVAQSFDA